MKLYETLNKFTLKACVAALNFACNSITKSLPVELPLVIDNIKIYLLSGLPSCDKYKYNLLLKSSIDSHEWGIVISSI